MRDVISLNKVPVLLTPDVPMYMGFAEIAVAGSQVAHNPWYGMPISSSKLAHLNFGHVSFLLLGALHKITNHWPTTLVLWNLFWTLLIIVSGFWLLHEFDHDAKPEFILMSISLLLLTNLTQLPETLHAWRILPSFAGFGNVNLPLLRPMFPQIVVPLLLCYLAFQLHALREGEYGAWFACGVLQLAAFTMFPHATLLMAATTGIVLLLSFITSTGIVKRRPIIIYAIACGLIDVTYLIVYEKNAVVARLSGLPLFSFDPAQFKQLVGGQVILISGLTILALIARVPRNPYARLSVISMGLGNVLLILVDILVSPLLEVSFHAQYFAHITTLILVVTLFRETISLLRVHARLVRGVTLCILSWAIINGCLTAGASFSKEIDRNRFHAELEMILGSLALGISDLVVAPARDVNDAAGWIPLVFSSKVLYYSNAEFALEDDQIGESRLRQLIYLIFTGRDIRDIQRDLSSTISAGKYVPIVKRIPLKGGRGALFLDQFRKEMMPALSVANSTSGPVQMLLSQYRRVIVVDSLSMPVFSKESVERYLDVKNDLSKDGFRILISNAK